MGVGKISESDSLEIGLDTHFLNEVYIQSGSSSKTLKNYIRSICLPTIVQSGSVSGVTVASGVWTRVNTVTLTSGYYSGTIITQINANSSGIRAVAFAPTSSSSDNLGNLQLNQPAQGSSVNRLALPIALHLTQTTEYAIWVYQNSGSSLTARGRYYLLQFA